MMSADAGSRRSGGEGPGRGPDTAGGSAVEEAPADGPSRESRRRPGGCSSGSGSRPSRTGPSAAPLNLGSRSARFSAARRNRARPTAPSRPPAAYRVHQLANVAVVVDPGRREVVTVLLRITRRWDHGRDNRDTRSSPGAGRSRSGRARPHPA